MSNASQPAAANQLRTNWKPRNKPVEEHAIAKEERGLEIFRKSLRSIEEKEELRSAGSQNKTPSVVA